MWQLVIHTICRGPNTLQSDKMTKSWFLGETGSLSVTGGIYIYVRMVYMYTCIVHNGMVHENLHLVTCLTNSMSSKMSSDLIICTYYRWNLCLGMDCQYTKIEQTTENPKHLALTSFISSILSTIHFTYLRFENSLTWFQIHNTFMFWPGFDVLTFNKYESSVWRLCFKFKFTSTNVKRWF